MNKVTLVTGLWDIGRGELTEGWSRPYEFYLDKFKEILKIDTPLIVFGESELESFVFERRSRDNTIFVPRDLEWFKQHFYKQIQKIRNDPDWFNQAGWLKESTQAKLEMYNPLVMSKMFLLNDAKILDPFSSDYLFWIDAGLANTVHPGYFTHDKVLDKIPTLIDRFTFVCYPYNAETEIHGFKFNKINQYAEKEVTKVARGGFFGGPKDTISEMSGLYYGYMSKSLNEGLMGTEESIFSIIVHKHPSLACYFKIGYDGLLSKFFEDVKTDKAVALVEEETTAKKIKGKKTVSTAKTNLYILTFNFPEQLQHTIDSMKKVPEWLEKPDLYLVDNSTDEKAQEKNKIIAEENNFTYLGLGKNIGICGGRQFVAEHFDESDADFMIFFEDDMTIVPASQKGSFCRMGFRKYVPELYKIVHKIALKENFDFLKLSFSELYWDNNIQTSWYNVPQDVRTKVWPNYDKLPVQGIDPNAPRTKFERIDSYEELAYAVGEVYYSNWPCLISKEGNKKMFIDTKWAHPYEQTWMSHIFQLTLEGKINPAVLLASPIHHDRIKYYAAHERREN